MPDAKTAELEIERYYELKSKMDDQIGYISCGISITEIRQMPAVDKLFEDAERTALVGKLQKFHQNNPSIKKIRRAREDEAQSSELLKAFEAADIKLEDLEYSIIFDKQGNPYALHPGGEELIGKGSSGEVKFLQNLSSGKWFAVKTLPTALEDVLKEYKFLETLGRFAWTTYRSSTSGGDEYIKLYIIQEAYLGLDAFGQMFDTICDANKFKKAGLENWTRTAISMVEETNYVHGHKILHNDIHRSNFIQLADGRCVLIDLEKAGYLDANGFYEAAPGGMNKYEVALEVRRAAEDEDEEVKVKYTTACDMYQLGNAFKEEFASLKEIYTAMQLGDDEIRRIFWQIDLLIADLHADDPKQRLTGPAALQRLRTLLDDIQKNINGLTHGEAFLRKIMDIAISDEVILEEISSNRSLLQHRNLDGQNAIHLAILQGRTQLAGKLLDFETEFTTQTTMGSSYLDLVVAKNDVDFDLAMKIHQTLSPVDSLQRLDQLIEDDMIRVLCVTPCEADKEIDEATGAKRVRVGGPG